ncbi:MAG: 50S ribosomal protein L5, partial [Fimbriimonadaceae bacterium]
MAKKTKEIAAPTGNLPAPRLKKVYQETVLPKLMEDFKYTSVMQAPKLVKIVVNMGTGNPDKDAKHLENSVRDMTLITGQKPIITL